MPLKPLEWLPLSRLTPISTSKVRRLLPSLVFSASNSCPGAKQDILARIAAIEALLKNGLGALPMTATGSLDLTALAAHCSTESQAIFARRQRLKEAALSIQSILKQ
jgi:hypothetical protein